MIEITLELLTELEVVLVPDKGLYAEGRLLGIRIFTMKRTFSIYSLYDIMLQASIKSRP